MARRPAKPTGPPKFTGEERIAVLHGPELFLHGEYTRHLREAIEQHTGAEAETIRHDGRTARLADVLDELRSFGLMRQHKVVIVHDADEFITAHREALERYAAAPVEIGTLVLRPVKWNAQWKLHKAIVKVGQVVKCEPPHHADAARWLVRRATERYGVKLDSRAAAALTDRLGTDLGRLDSELAKLAAAVPEGEAIDPRRVDALVGRASEEKAWEIQEALLSASPGHAIAKLHELIDLSGQADVLVTYFVADLVRKLHHAAAMLAERQPEAAVCKALRVWGPRQGPFLQAARRLGSGGAARLLATLVDMDSRSKSGYGTATMNLERFCVQFAAALR